MASSPSRAPASGTLPGLVGEAAGSVGVAGRSAARLAIKAAAVGDRGQVGAAVAVLKCLTCFGFGRRRRARLGFGHDRDDSRAPPAGGTTMTRPPSIAFLLAA